MPLQYYLVSTQKRRLHKFSVRGTDYVLRVDPIPDGTTFAKAILMVHNLFKRK
jgi:hypothetical protein